MPDPKHPDVPPAAASGLQEASPEQAVEEGNPALRSFLGLFVVPLLVVILCVAIFVGFGWIAYERQGTSDYLNDLQSWWKPRRVQAAYELSRILVTDPDALAQEPGAQAELRRIFQSTEDPEMRRYLALVLGRTRDPEALPLLTGALDDPDEESRIYALWALGALGDPAAAPVVVERLEDPDPGIRKTAAYALGAIGQRSAVPHLEEALEDPVADVRWNAALSLASLGSDAGVPVLETMVDRRHLAQVPEITREQQEEAMIGAVRALAAVGGPEVRPVLDRLAEEDPSLKVRQAALQAREAMER